MASDGSVAHHDTSGIEAEKSLEQASSIGEQNTHESIRDPSVKAQQLFDEVLRFISKASNETLGACLAGLGAITYLVLGRVGLLLIGLVGGIALHATWEENGFDPKTHGRRQKEEPVDVLRRVFDWRRDRNIDESTTGGGLEIETSTSSSLDFSTLPPATGAALTGLTDAVIRDYVKWWYGPIVPEDLSFPSTCRQLLTRFLLSISSRLSRKRPADVFLDFLTNSSSVVIIFLNELASSLATSAYSGVDVAGSLHQYMEQRPNSSLANLLDQDQQRFKLNAVADDMLQAFLDGKAYSCEPVRVFLRQMLASVCLEMTLQSCSKPEWINGWIVYLLEQDESQLLDSIESTIESTTAIDSAMPGVSDPNDLFAETSASSLSNVNNTGHRRTVSRAEEAMDEAMQEAKRLSEMIAAEEAKKSQVNEESISSGFTSRGDPTPTSSQSDIEAMNNNLISESSGDTATELLAQQATHQEPPSSFTNFDQILSSQAPTALQNGHIIIQPDVPPLTLYNASISIFDDAVPGEKGTIRSKPTIDYLLQVEPATSQHPGWMIARKYADFETLHEVLRRISVISGVPEFADKHAIIPGWRNRSKDALRQDLEGYLRDALSFNRLAESEGMKRFLEKDQGLGQSSPNAKQGGFGFPSPSAFETMGKGMLDVLSAAPKGAAGGGKAILGGVTGVLGGVGALGQKKPTSSGTNKSAQPPNANLTRTETNKSWTSDAQSSRISHDVSRNSFNDLGRSGALPENTMPAEPEEQAARSPNLSSQLIRDTQPKKNVDSPANNESNSRLPSLPAGEPNGLHLPPPPSEIPDDWTTSPPPARKSISTDDFQQPAPATSTPPPQPPRPPKPPLTEPETRVAIELFFATITSLYTLSSAWSIRRTLLTAAKNFLLRPGNPNLEAIRLLLQSSCIDANISDEGMAAHIHKIRVNALPTEEEMKSWPKEPMGEEEKRELRVRARALLVERGVPQALTSVMGMAASGEAVGRVFDALQVEEVSRGVVFALVLQGLRALVL
ncbi:MAG: hypothetical protein Q9222_002905 [Ikaeria aurantiellina]